jgi:hypothetical protein
MELAHELRPDLDKIIIDDGAPVDGILSEKQMRLLTETLYTSWAGPGEGRPFLVLANVGLFFAEHLPPLVPDVMLSVDMEPLRDLRQRRDLSYFVWERGKTPDVTIEIVSNREGGEDERKLRDYARIHIPYYVIFDPDQQLRGGVLRIFGLQGMEYGPLTASANGVYWFRAVGLGLRLWEGVFEGVSRAWLRWCDQDGKVIPTGAEVAEEQRQRAEQERQRAEQANESLRRMREQLRALGIEPPE